MLSGPGCARTVPPDCSGTCILHFMSSMGVRRREVKAPEAAPEMMSADMGSLSVEADVEEE